MEGVQDMDDLLDELEANLAKKPERVVEMDESTLKVTKLQRSEIAETTQAEITLTIDEPPPSFKPKQIIPTIEATSSREMEPKKQEQKHEETTDLEYEECLKYLNECSSPVPETITDRNLAGNEDGTMRRCSPAGKLLEVTRDTECQDDIEPPLSDLTELDSKIEEEEVLRCKGIEYPSEFDENKVQKEFEEDSSSLEETVVERKPPQASEGQPLHDHSVVRQQSDLVEPPLECAEELQCFSKKSQDSEDSAPQVVEAAQLELDQDPKEAQCSQDHIEALETLHGSEDDSRASHNTGEAPHCSQNHVEPPEEAQEKENNAYVPEQEAQASKDDLETPQDTEETKNDTSNASPQEEQVAQDNLETPHTEKCSKKHVEAQETAQGFEDAFREEAKDSQECLEAQCSLNQGEAQETASEDNLDAPTQDVQPSKDIVESEISTNDVDAPPKEAKDSHDNLEEAICSQNHAEDQETAQGLEDAPPKEAKDSHDNREEAQCSEAHAFTGDLDSFEKTNEAASQLSVEIEAQGAVAGLEVASSPMAATNEQPEPCSIEQPDENRPRFDSSIATVHVLNESDSDEAQPSRERRLTESELQLGKTCPYWIPDADCPFCMLCNTKFTLITRRHHCRACGRVLCGSCCNERSILEYLEEEGKKNQPVRVCKSCSSMLTRIQAYEDEQKSATSAENEAEGSSAAAPKGVLKTRSSENQEEVEERRSVVFRDGVRPGAHEHDGEEQRATAVKPKKKSRKRHSVVRRIAELRMEDELASALPSPQQDWLIQQPNGDTARVEEDAIVKKLDEGCRVVVVLKKNLTATVQRKDGVCSVSTNGFAQIGLDELFIAWYELEEEQRIPLPVFKRIEEIYCHSTEAEFAGVRMVEQRFSRIQTSPDAEKPLTRNLLLFRPSVQDFGALEVPSNPFLVACFVNDDELQWASASPNRLLHRLGLMFGCYPTPIVNTVGRKSAYSMETSGTVLKMFTDFRSWSYRMRHLAGCTISLRNEETIVRIPSSSVEEVKELASNGRMMAWRADVSPEDDSLLVCDEVEPGMYNTQVLARFGSVRESTSASFIVIDGGAKVNGLQISVIEDGVAIRVAADKMERIVEAMRMGEDFVEKTEQMELRIVFVEDEQLMVSEFSPVSRIDGKKLANKYQYGLSLERALTQVLQVQGISNYGIRMSHVFNMRKGRLSPDEEPKIYGMAEHAAKECATMMEPHMMALIATDILNVSIRLMVRQDEIEYDVSEWIGLEEANMEFRQSLHQLIPMLMRMSEYVPNGFEVEIVLSIVSMRAI